MEQDSHNRRQSKAWSQALGQNNKVSIYLLGLHVLFYLAYVFADMTQDSSVFAFLDQLILFPFDTGKFAFFQPLTYFLISTSFWIVLINGYVLYSIAIAVEDTIGTKRFLLLYLAANVIGGLAFAAFHQGANPLIGNGAGLVALLAFYGFTFPQQEFLLAFVIPIKARYFIPLLFFYCLFLVFKDATEVNSTWDGIGMMGGFITAAALYFFWQWQRKSAFKG